MSESGQFDEAVQHRLSRLREELAAAVTDNDYAGAAWAESAMQDLQRLHRENSAGLQSDFAANPGSAAWTENQPYAGCGLMAG